jgi:hypothetical protein
MSNDDTNRSDDLKQVEQSLRSLEPGEAGVNRDRLMYEAGWGACESAMNRATPAVAARSDVKVRQARNWLWPATSAALLLISATLATVLVTRQPEKEFVYAYIATRAADSAIEAAEPKPVENQQTGHTEASINLPWLTVLQSLSAPVASTDPNYLTLRSRVLAFGVDVLPSAAISPSKSDSATGSPRYGDMRGVLLGG